MHCTLATRWGLWGGGFGLGLQLNPQPSIWSDKGYETPIWELLMSHSSTLNTYLLSTCCPPMTKRHNWQMIDMSVMLLSVSMYLTGLCSKHSNYVNRLASHLQMSCCAIVYSWLCIRFASITMQIIIQGAHKRIGNTMRISTRVCKVKLATNLGHSVDLMPIVENT